MYQTSRTDDDDGDGYNNVSSQVIIIIMMSRQRDSTQTSQNYKYMYLHAAFSWWQTIKTERELVDKCTKLMMTMTELVFTICILCYLFNMASSINKRCVLSWLLVVVHFFLFFRLYFLQEKSCFIGVFHSHYFICRLWSNLCQNIR